MILMTVLLSVNSQAQGGCPLGSASATVVFDFMWNGQCCQVEVTACLTPSPNPSVNIKSIKLNGDCWGTVDPSTFPYNTVAELAYEKFVLRKGGPDPLTGEGYLNIGTIPQCPATTNYTIETKIGGCGVYMVYQVPVQGPNGTVTQKTVREYFVCSYQLCERTCTVCIMATTDDCNGGESRLFWTCEGTVSAPECPTTGCIYPMCGGLP